MSGIIGKNTSRSSGIIGTSAGGMASLAADSSPQLGGFLDAAGNYIQMEKGGDISSASPTVIDTDGDFFACTGTTNFSAFTVAADRHWFLEFGGALTMTHGNGTLDLPGGANITTAASDVGEFISTAANVVTCVNYTKRDGTAVVAASGLSVGLVEGTRALDAASGTQDFTGFGFDPTVWAVHSMVTISGDNSVGYAHVSAAGPLMQMWSLLEDTRKTHIGSHNDTYLGDSPGNTQESTSAAITDGVRMTFSKTGTLTSGKTIAISIMAWG